MKLPSPKEVIRRSVHVAMTPRPCSLAESGRVREALEQFGPVASFWHFKYEPQGNENSALAIFADKAAAERALTTRTMQIVADARSEPPSAGSPDDSPPAAAAGPSGSPASGSRMQLAIRPGRVWLQSRVTKHPDHWPFALEPTDAPGWAMLGPDLPAGLRGATCLQRRGPDLGLLQRQQAENRWAAQRAERGWGSLGELWRQGELRRRELEAAERAGEGRAGDLGRQGEVKGE